VSEISCGDAHVAALTKEGEVFTWGCGEFGKLSILYICSYSTRFFVVEIEYIVCVG
jgi:alpha-tubulin suppressor-like RCC1 family protein